MKDCKQKAFTLIEVLFVMAILSVVGMISLPFYQNYTIRAKISGEFPRMHPLMLRMSEEFAMNDRWPLNNVDAGGYEPAYYNGKYLESVEISDDPQPGTMILTYDAVALPVLRDSNTLVFYPKSNSSGANWECDQGTIPAKYRPPECR